MILATRSIGVRGQRGVPILPGTSHKSLLVRFGDPDHDRVLRTKKWSDAKTTWSS